MHQINRCINSDRCYSQRFLFSELRATNKKSKIPPTKFSRFFCMNQIATTRTDIWPIEKVYWRKGKSDSIRSGLFEPKERKKNLIRNRNMYRHWWKDKFQTIKSNAVCCCFFCSARLSFWFARSNYECAFCTDSLLITVDQKNIKCFHCFSLSFGQAIKIFA